MTLVLIADDSSIFAEVLAEVLAEDRDLTVAGVAEDGARAVAMARALRPDVIVMDVVMPVLDGFESVSQILAEHPLPVLMMTGDARGRTAHLGFEGLRRGAIDLMLKPARWPFTLEQRRMLRERVRAVAHMRPIRSHSSLPPTRLSLLSSAGRSVSVVGIAASTGGPSALSALLHTLPADFPAGIAVVQHLAPGFVEPLARWLAAQCSFRVTVARDRDHCRPGTVLLAPDNLHMTIDADARVRLSATPDRTSHRPAADVLFESLAAGLGSHAAGVVLTGEGDDGARGLLAMRRAGATTLAQDETSSVAFGMPRASILSGATDRVVPFERIVATLTGIAGAPAGLHTPVG